MQVSALGYLLYVVIGSLIQALLYHAIWHAFAMPIALTHGHIYALVATINAHIAISHFLMSKPSDSARPPFRDFMTKALFLQLGLAVMLVACLIVGELAGWVSLK